MKLKSKIRSCERCGGRFVVLQDGQTLCPQCRAEENRQNRTDLEKQRVFGGEPKDRSVDILDIYHSGQLINKALYAEYEVTIGAVTGKVYIDRTLEAVMRINRKE